MSHNGEPAKTAPEHLREYCWKPGESGNPNGRPKSARSRLSESFLKALADDFDANGVEAVIAAREKNPGEYLRVVAALQPKQVEGSEDPDAPAIKHSVKLTFE